MKKVVKFLYPILSLLLLTMLTACSSKPPKYNGESAEAYGEKLGKYYGEKFKNAGAKNIRKYLNVSNKVIENLKESIPHLTNKQLVEKVDDTIKKLIDLSDKYLDIGEEDYKFLANPLKYYGIYDDYSNLVQIAIGDKGGIQLLSAINELIERSYGKRLYTPLDVKYVLLGALVGDDNVFFYKDALAKQIDKADKYYYVLTHTKYKIFFGDDDWIKEYKSEKDIINTAIKIAKKEKLYFDVDENKLKKLKEKIHDLKFNKFKEYNEKYQHNIKVFIKTLKILFNKGYSRTQIVDSLLGGNYDCNKKDIMSIDTNKNLDLDTWDSWRFREFKRCFREYMKKMKKLLSNQ